MHPTAEELPGLRKGLRKRAVPHVFDGMWSSQPGIGGVIFNRDGSTYRVEWVAGASEKVQPRKKAMFDELCKRPEMELERLEIGYLLHDLCAHQASEVMNSMGGPNEAMSATAPIWKAADDWKHWGLVPAGHMKV
jgi:hypothetical protein